MNERNERLGNCYPLGGPIADDDALGQKMIEAWNNASRMRCRCICQGERCADEATQEDGLCDWCGKRTPEQEREHPNAMFGADGQFLGIGGRGLSHAMYSCWDGRTRRELATIR